MDHRVSYKVYYEDTDCLGIVYYANYLKFMERGRTEFLAAQGKAVQDWNRDGYLIVVHALQMTFRRTATLGDVLDVISTFTLTSRFRGRFHQRIERSGEVVVTAEVEVVCLDDDQQLVSFPAELQALGHPAPPLARRGQGALPAITPEAGDHGVPVVYPDNRDAG
ncbi:MAG TPA: YbgC/FadM family acyl-CoA thioesterase [Kineosporiaceae bacterium]